LLVSLPGKLFGAGSLAEDSRALGNNTFPLPPAVDVTYEKAKIG